VHINALQISISVKETTIDNCLKRERAIISRIISENQLKVVNQDKIRSISENAVERIFKLGAMNMT